MSPLRAIETTGIALRPCLLNAAGVFSITAADAGYIPRFGGSMLNPRQFCALLALVAACAPAATVTSVPAPASSTAGSAARVAQPSASGGRDVILAAEISASKLEALTAEDVIRRLRPHMLQPRIDAHVGGQRVTRPLVVFINGAEAGGVEVLRTIVAQNVARIQFMTAVEAANRLSLRQLTGGAIVITLK